MPFSPRIQGNFSWGRRGRGRRPADLLRAAPLPTLGVHAGHRRPSRCAPQPRTGSCVTQRRSTGVGRLEVTRFPQPPERQRGGGAAETSPGGHLSGLLPGASCASSPLTARSSESRELVVAHVPPLTQQRQRVLMQTSLPAAVPEPELRSSQLCRRELPRKGPGLPPQRKAEGIESKGPGGPSSPTPTRPTGRWPLAPGARGEGSTDHSLVASHSLSSVISRNCAYTSRTHSPLGLNRNL